MPPSEVEVWGGDDKNKMKLLNKVHPTRITEKEKNAVAVEVIKINLEPSAYKQYKIVAKNIAKLPAWHPGKGDKAWLFIDEIFFN